MIEYSKAMIKDGQLIITESKHIDQSTLKSDCWSIQFDGLKACETCEIRDTEECGGGEVLKAMQAQ